MARIYLGLGSNIDARHNLQMGIRELESRYGELSVSPIYQSRAVGFEGPDFLNLVVGCSTDSSPDEVHEAIEAIHRKAGRKRGEEKFASRPLDIDLLLYDDLVIAEPPLRLPRSDVLEYSFVLRPLAELAPDLVHPVTGKTMAEHWEGYDAEAMPLTPVSRIL
ncbi:MAG TPA: 2-amino-4-hydroxy-6-hydroxymethyldihydropteridine diphosphokinase [Woeseiaceae bacterium]|jgi:2-amino-4-hydroxy-6-hydroxymethyldihydropteridine diphosphokinase|nr:2-amino-4-hydroxy-6-hydroxymethyldihydropteridine diphosphokinase [Woeseiaceae bacterium]